MNVMVRRVVQVVAVLAMMPVASARAASERAYAGGSIALELGGANVGLASKAFGGEPIAEVISEQPGADRVVKKHLGPLGYEPIRVEAGTGMATGFYDWIRETLERRPAPRTGSLVALDFNFREVQRTNFFNALITEIAFPAVDASKKEPANIAVTFAPEAVRFAPGSGQPMSSVKQGPTAQKRLIPAYFRLRIDGIDCTRVATIDPVLVRQKVNFDAAGAGRPSGSRLLPTGILEISNLVVTLNEAGAASFYAWRDDFLASGNSADIRERNGTLEFLTPDLKTTLFVLTLKHVGIFSMGAEQAGATRIVRAKMYVEDVGFGYDRAAAM